MTALLVLTNVPDPATADTLAAEVIDRRLAACVNVLAPCRSLYHWQGKVESASEIPLLIKTTDEHYPALEAAIRRLHPYTVPEILALPIAHGLPEYLAWLTHEITVPEPATPSDADCQ